MVKIVFTASQTWIGRFIRWLTRGTVSHAMIEYSSSTWGGQWIAEATFTGVRMVPAIRARRHVVCEYECLFPTSLALKEVAQYVGDHYDYAGLLRFGGALLVWRLFRTKFRRPLHATSGQFCSEFVARFLQAAKIPGPDKWDPERISPERIREFCKGRCEYFRPINVCCFS